MSRVIFYLNFYEEIRKRAQDDPDFFKDKSNQVPVYVDFSFGNRLRTSTRIFVNPNDWDNDRQRVKASDPDSGPKNYRLTTIRGKLINIETEAFRDNIKLSISYIKQKLAPGLQVKDNGNSETFFMATWNDFVDLNPDLNESTKHNYHNTWAVFKDYSIKYNIPLTFDNIDDDFYQGLKRYSFNDRKLTRNTVGKYVKNLKAFMNHCTKKGLTTNLAYKKFEVYKDRKMITYLTLEEIKTLRHLEIESEVTRRARDLFLFCCFSGLRYSDTQKINPENIREGYIFFTSVKTKQPQATPITPQALKILKQYDFKLPRMTLPTYNNHLKKLGEAANINQETTQVTFVGSKRMEETKPKFKFFSSHLAKRTYISIFFRSGGRIETIMQTTGNKDRKTMKHYLEIMNPDVKNETDKAFRDLDV